MSAPPPPPQEPMGFKPKIEMNCQPKCLEICKEESQIVPKEMLDKYEKLSEKVRTLKDAFEKSHLKFNDWKEMYKNHRDKNIYNDYLEKWSHYEDTCTKDIEKFALEQKKLKLEIEKYVESNRFKNPSNSTVQLPQVNGLIPNLNLINPFMTTLTNPNPAMNMWNQLGFLNPMLVGPQTQNMYTMPFISPMGQKIGPLPTPIYPTFQSNNNPGGVMPNMYMMPFGMMNPTANIANGPFLPQNNNMINATLSPKLPVSNMQPSTTTTTMMTTNGILSDSSDKTNQVMFSNPNESGYLSQNNGIPFNQKMFLNQYSNKNSEEVMSDTIQQNMTDNQIHNFELKENDTNTKSFDNFSYNDTTFNRHNRPESHIPTSTYHNQNITDFVQQTTKTVQKPILKNQMGIDSVFTSNYANDNLINNDLVPNTTNQPDHYEVRSTNSYSVPCQQENAISPTVVPLESIINPQDRRLRPKITVIIRGMPGTGQEKFANVLADLEIKNGGHHDNIKIISIYDIYEYINPDNLNTLQRINAAHDEMVKIYRRMISHFDLLILVGIFDLNSKIFEIAQESIGHNLDIFVVEMPHNLEKTASEDCKIQMEQQLICEMQDNWQLTPTEFYILDIQSVYNLIFN